MNDDEEHTDAEGDALLRHSKLTLSPTFTINIVTGLSQMLYVGSQAGAFLPIGCRAWSQISQSFDQERAEVARRSPLGICGRRYNPAVCCFSLPMLRW